MRGVLLFALAAGLALGAPTEKRIKKPMGKKTAVPASSLTGCLDQRGADYVLAGVSDLKQSATLKADGFSEDNFARYVGHKVTVEGILMKDTDPVMMRVRKVTDIEEHCAPGESKSED